MGYSAGGSCFTTPHDAAVYGCAVTAPTVLQDGAGGAAILSCESVTGTVATWRRTEIASAPGTGIALQAEFPVAPCMEQEFLDAGIVVFVALASAWVMVWGLWRVYRLVEHYRGVDA